MFLSLAPWQIISIALFIVFIVLLVFMIRLLVKTARKMKITEDENKGQDLR